MHSASYLTTLALAASTVFARPAPILSEASSVIEEYAAGATSTIGDYIETGIGADVGATPKGQVSKDHDNAPSATPKGDKEYDDESEGFPGSNEGGMKHGSRPDGRGGKGPGGHWSWIGDNDDEQAQQECMSREEALKVAGTFQSLIQGYTKEEALAALTPDFYDYTSAVSIIINKGGSGPEDVTAPVFTSREEFMAGHGTQEPIPFETLKVWSTCDGVVSMVWRSIRSGQGQENETAAIPVTGTAVLETEPTSQSTGIERERAEAGGYNYRIHTLWSEFNTAAWLVNNGVLKTQSGVPLTPVPENETTPSPPSTITRRGEEITKFNVGLA